MQIQAALTVYECTRKQAAEDFAGLLRVQGLAFVRTPKAVRRHGRWVVNVYIGIDLANRELLRELLRIDEAIKSITGARRKLAVA